VWVLGRRLEPGDADVVRHIGFTADEPPLYDAMTVRTFLRFIAAGYGSTGPEVDERIDFWLERLWLTEKADQPIAALSRGMRQRIGIARTLLPNPAVILLDEPAAGLDPAGRAQFRELLMSLRRQGKALIVSSHILSDLAEYCSHVAIMARGRMVRYGTVAEISHDEDTHGSTYTVRLAEPVTPEMQERILGVEGVAAVRVHEEKLEIESRTQPPGKAGAARLLADLVAAGLPVCSFTIEAGGLEQAYLRSGIAQVD
jgi:ABC-2 type transport system ATP-binding protein